MKKAKPKARAKAKPKAPKEKPQDGGLSPKQKQQLRSAIRQVWQWSYARRLCLARAIAPDGFPRCEQCKKKVVKVYADHIEPCGDICDPGYIERTFRASTYLQSLCSKCHNKKTAQERKAAKPEPITEADF